MDLIGAQQKHCGILFDKDVTLPPIGIRPGDIAKLTAFCILMAGLVGFVSAGVTVFEA